MSIKSPKAVDVIVGANVRRLRKFRHMSQEKLGDALGITFQQVHKYEKGTNRVSASTLVAITAALGVEVNDLFAGITNQPASEPMLQPSAKGDGDCA